MSASKIFDPFQQVWLCSRSQQHATFDSSKTLGDFDLLNQTTKQREREAPKFRFSSSLETPPNSHFFCRPDKKLHSSPALLKISNLLESAPNDFDLLQYIGLLWVEWGSSGRIYLPKADMMWRTHNSYWLDTKPFYMIWNPKKGLFEYIMTL